MSEIKPNTLTRQQISEFVKDPRAIRAIEDLFLQVANIIPLNIQDVEQLLYSQRKPDVNAFAHLEQFVAKRDGLEDVKKRLSTIESYLGIAS